MGADSDKSMGYIHPAFAHAHSRQRIYNTKLGWSPSRPDIRIAGQNAASDSKADKAVSLRVGWVTSLVHTLH